MGQNEKIGQRPIFPIRAICPEAVSGKSRSAPAARFLKMCFLPAALPGQKMKSALCRAEALFVKMDFFRSVIFAERRSAKLRETEWSEEQEQQALHLCTQMRNFFKIGFSPISQKCIFGGKPPIPQIEKTKKKGGGQV